MTLKQSAENAIFSYPKDTSNRPPMQATADLFRNVRHKFDTVALLEANADLSYTSGAQWYVSEDDYIEAEGFHYKVAASGASDHHLTTAGGVKLYVQRLKDGSVNVAQFGETGNESGDDAVFRAALDFFDAEQGGAQGTVRFSGRINLASTITLGKRVTIEGIGPNFGNTIRPTASFSGTEVLNIDGADVSGGFSFGVRLKNFMIDCQLLPDATTVTEIVKIKDAYGIGMSDVWLFDVVGKGITIESTNWATFDRVSLYGRNTGVADIGIQVKNAGTGGDGGGGVFINDCDVEVFVRGVLAQTNARVTINGGYMERNIRGWETTASDDEAHFTAAGLVVEGINSSTECAVVGPGAQNVTVLGGTYDAKGGEGIEVTSGTRPKNLQIINANGPVNDPRNYAKQSRDSTRDYRSEARKSADLSDEIATDMFSVTMPFTSTHFARVEVDVMARDASGFSVRTSKFTFLLTNADGTLRATTPTEGGINSADHSGNYSLTVSAAVSISGTTATFELTANTGGSLGAGTVTRVSAVASVKDWDGSGAVYITAL